VASGAGLQVNGQAPAAPSLQVDLLSSVSGVEAGKRFEVALRFKIQDGWHMYWKNSGDSGQPPRVNWNLPPGFSASELSYPVPSRDHAPGGIITNILKGEVFLLASITPPANLAPGGTIELAADLQVLVCDKACIQLKRAVRTSLPTLAAGAATPDNADLFETARRRLPETQAAAKYARIDALASVDRVRPKDQFEIAVLVDVGPGFHIQSNKPFNESLIATDLFLENVEGVSFSALKFPTPTLRQVGQEKVAEFSGRVPIRFQGQADNTLPAGPLKLGGIVRYQACNDEGRCFAAQNVAWALEVPTAPEGEAIRALHPEVFAAAPAGPAPAAAPGSEHSKAQPLPGLPPKETTDAPAVADIAGAPPATSSSSGTSAPAPQASLAWYMLMAALGGLIMNIMPCVLPVISIKVLSFMQQAGEHPRRVFHLGLVFAAGIMVSFLGLAVVVVVMHRIGLKVGWGFQLSNPYAVIVLAAIMFTFALNLFGVFEIVVPGKAMSKLSAAEAREGLSGAFFKGVLATVLATPCTAPFMGPAITVAFQDSSERGSWSSIVLILGAMGLGMALPYVLLTWKPGWMRYLPKPGPWMERFKQFMGFLLMATVVYLMMILGALIEADGVVWTLGFLCFLGLAAWILGLIDFGVSRRRRWGIRTLALTVVIVGWFLVFGKLFDINQAMNRPAGAFATDSPPGVIKGADWLTGIPWQDWAPGRAEQLASAGFTVYVDYTATWCPTCIVNKKVALEVQSVRQRMRELGVYPIKADYTKQPPEMTRELAKHNAQAVPLNIILPACRPEQPIILPSVLLPNTVLEKLDQAGPSREDQTCQS
jgi:thiol:disulfide interchange protein